MDKKTMMAANLHAVADLRYEAVPMPERKTGEVLLKVMAAGICGSDLPRVLEKGTYHFPTIPGHEFAGLIVEADNAALVGRKAAIFPLLPCGKCEFCQVGEYVKCVDYDYYGSRRDGGFAEYLAVKEENLVLLDDAISYEVAAMCEPAAVARAAIRRLSVQLGDLCVIYGAGPIGLIAAQWARAAGAGCVRVVDISEEKLAFARTLGFEGYDPERDGMADCALEGTGASAALNNAILAVKANGRIVLMGNPMRDMEIKQSTYSQLLRKEIVLAGTWNSSYNDRVNDWRATVDAMAKGTIEIASLVTHRYQLSECNEAFSMMAGRKTFYNKVMFVADEA